MVSTVGKHTAALAQETANPLADVEIQFSKQLSGLFKKVAKLVRNDERYDGDLKPILAHLASGEPMNIVTAMGYLVTTTEEATRYANKTNNYETFKTISNALEAIENAAGEPEKQTAIIQVHAKNKGRL